MNFTYSTSGNKISIEVGEIFYKYIVSGNAIGVGSLTEEGKSDMNKMYNFFPDTKSIELTYQCTDKGLTFETALLGSKNWQSYDFTTLY